MIKIDRASSTPVFEQLLAQLRFQIASGKYAVGARLPSTRKLAEQIGISFHTVRKAYQALESEGLVTSKIGSGFVVTEAAPLDKETRLERGAEEIQTTLQRLIGLGLQDGEIEYLFDEQLTYLDRTTEDAKWLFAAPFLEMAELCAAPVSDLAQTYVAPVRLNDLLKHQDADAIFVPLPYVAEARAAVPLADVIGVMAYPDPALLDTLARKLPHESVGLITQYPHAIRALTETLRHYTAFAGNLIATSIETGTGQLAEVLREADFVVYTPQCRRKLKALLRHAEKDHAALRYFISPYSHEAIKSARST